MLQGHPSAEESTNVIYDATPVGAQMAAWLLAGIGGIVLFPIALLRGDYWLLFLASPLLVSGLLLFALRLRIVAAPSAAALHVTISFLGLQLLEHWHARSEITALDVHRVAGDYRERASDTWYLRMRIGRRAYTLGKHDSRMDALLARRDIEQTLETLPLAIVSDAAPRADPEQSEDDRQAAARDHYKTGITLFRAGDREGARYAFEKALTMAEQPLLRRMIEQRLKELEPR